MATNSATNPEDIASGLGPEMTEADLWVLDVMRRAQSVQRDPVDFDLFETCELLELDRHTKPRTYALALVLGLQEALGRPPEFRTSGEADLSFDEFWLMRLIERSRHHDAESVAFLISSRVMPHCRNSLVFLVAGLVERLELEGPAGVAAL